MLKKFNEYNQYKSLDDDIQDMFAELKDNGFAATVTDKGNGTVEVFIDFESAHDDPQEWLYNDDVVDDDVINFFYGEIKDKVLQFVEFYKCISCMFYVYDFTYIPINLDIRDLYEMQDDRTMAVLSITIEI